MKYLKVWTSFREVMEPLADDEKGRLFDMMLNYAESFTEPAEFTGNERFTWPAAKQLIDLTYSENVKQRENGKKGGRPKTQENPEEPNETQKNPEKPNETLKEKKRKEIERKEKESSFMDDAEAAEIASDHEKLLSAAEAAGFGRNDATRAKLIALYAEHGLDKMLAGIGSCVDHGVSTIAYLAAVLKGEPKKQAVKKTVTAQDYEQRDYTEVQDDLIRRQKERFAARLGRVG